MVAVQSVLVLDWKSGLDWKGSSIREKQVCVVSAGTIAHKYQSKAGRVWQTLPLCSQSLYRRATAALDACPSFDCRRSSLQVTELLPMEIESGLEKIQPEGDAQRIEELLSLPRNPSSPHQQSKHWGPGGCVWERQCQATPLLLASPLTDVRAGSCASGHLSLIFFFLSF